MSVKNILLQSLEKSAEIHKLQMEEFYPGLGNEGIHESNLIRILIQALQEDCGYRNVVGWSELSFLRRSRLDSGIKLIHKDAVILVEAKRIRQGKTRGTYNSKIALKQIVRDSGRLYDKERCESVVLRSKAASLYRVLIAAVWLSNKPHMQEAYARWMDGSAFHSDWKGDVVAETPEIWKGKSSSLKLLIAISEVEKFK
ncbi:MAG: hypothetical protein COA47_14750 [Robiginitomaculum sp.]|nr:MAG: hypothetical protein COA47_14750 [Robiginitomaculum sp.]